MAIAGKHTRFAVSTDGTQWKNVAGLNSASMDMSGDNQDITTFGDDFVRRVQGLKDCTYSISGFWEDSDTGGQQAVFNAWLDDTTLRVRFLYDGTNGFEQEVKVSNPGSLSAAPDGMVEAEFELEGTGPISLVSGA